MNYGKKKAAKRQKKITSKSTMQGKRIVVRLFKALLICIVLAAVVGVAGGGLFIKKILMTLRMFPLLTLNRKDLPLSSTPMTAAQRLNDLYLPVLTGYTNPLMRYQKICSMLLLRLKMNVFTNTTV